MIKLNRRIGAGAFVVGALLVFSSSAHGQAIGMLEDERAVTALGGPDYEDYRHGGGVIYGGATPTAAPLNFAYSDDASSSPTGSTADVSQTVFGNFGQLDVATTGSSNSSPTGGGSFVWSSTYWGGDAVVGFVDYITPSENMTVDLTYTIQGQSSFTGNGSYANVTAAYDFNTLGVGLRDFALNGTQVYGGQTHLLAGNQYLLFVGLGWDCDSNSNSSGYTTGSFEMSASGQIQITSLTPGAYITSESGYDYATPEPAGILPLGLGAGLFIWRRRRR